MFKMNLIWASSLAFLCLAAPVVAQTQPAPVPPPAPTQQPATPTLAQPQTTPPAQLPGQSTVPGAPQVSPAMPGQTPPAGATSPLSESQLGSAVILLDRILQVLDKAVDGKSDQVSLDRGLLDEVRAEVTQVKRTLQGERP